MTISLFEARKVRFELSSEEEIVNILAPGLKMKRIKTLHFHQLPKETILPSVLFILAKRPRYGLFLF